MTKKMLLPKKVNKLSNVIKSSSNSAPIISASMLPPPDNKSQRKDINTSIRAAIKSIRAKAKKK